MCLINKKSNFDDINYILKLKKALYNYYKYELNKEQPREMQEEYDIKKIKIILNKYGISEKHLLEYELYI